MPELPEVETSARALRPQVSGRMITAVRNTWRRHIDRPSFDELATRLAGQKVTGVSRRGKFLVFHLDSDELLIIHLRMTGHLAVLDAGTPLDVHTHTVFVLDNGQELRFRDTRKFGRVYLVAQASEVLGKLGPEPLDEDFNVEKLSAILRERKRLLKPFLLDQHMIAGIGNIYADEALFYAGIDPRRRTDTLTNAEIERLHEGIQHVLRLGIAREGASITSYVKPDGEKGDMQNAMAVFRRTGQPCYKCRRPVQRIILGGRSTHFCGVCQA